MSRCHTYRQSRGQSGSLFLTQNFSSLSIVMHMFMFRPGYRKQNSDLKPQRVLVLQMFWLFFYGSIIGMYYFLSREQDCLMQMHSEMLTLCTDRVCLPLYHPLSCCSLRCPLPSSNVCLLLALVSLWPPWVGHRRRGALQADGGARFRKCLSERRYSDRRSVSCAREGTTA